MKKSGFLLLLLLFPFSCSTFENDTDATSKLEIVLQQIGKDYLASQPESTYTIIPVQEKEQNTFKIQFKEQHNFEPSIFVTSINKNLKKVKLSRKWVVTLRSCNNTIAIYSYHTSNTDLKNIALSTPILLPSGNYCMDIKLPKETPSRLLFYTLVVSVLFFLVFVFASRFFTQETDADVL